MSKHAKFCGVIAAASLALGACTTLPVTTDVNPNFSVATCHSYSFAPERVPNADQPAPFSNPLNAERLRNAIESNMAARGVSRVNDGADCVVGYAMGTRQVFNDYYAGWGMGWGYGWGPRGYGYWGYDGPWVDNETRISVDIFDAKSRKPMWHGAVSQSVSDLRGPNAVAKINAATAAIFAKLPIGRAPSAGAAPPPPPAAAASAAEPAAAPPIFMYPKNGQSAEQQANDRRECEQWASQQPGAGAAGSPGYQRALVACVEGRGYSVK
jgi:Domain of unknown function (DUF4136)